MRSASIAIIQVLFTLSLAAQETEVIYLTGTGYDDTKTWDFFCTEGMNSKRWTTIGVPSCWELQGFGSYNYGLDKDPSGEEGFYKKTFFAPSSWQGECVTIVFEGVMTDAEVKINGKPAGPIHQGAFYRFSYDISELLHFNDSNLLEVTVSKVSSNALVNAAEREADYWIFGGIFRPVYLTIMPEDHIDRVAIDARADGSFTMTVFHSLNHNGLILSARIITPDGNMVGKPFLIPADRQRGYTPLFIKIDDPALVEP